MNLTMPLAALTILFSIPGSVQAGTGNAEHCARVKQSDDGKSYQSKNKCAEPVTIAYCSAGKPFFQQRCGEGKSPNAFYTHMRTLAPGETTNFPLADGRFAYCLGKINPFGKNMPFQSDRNGDYRCEAPPQEAAAQGGTQVDHEEVTYMTASVPGFDRALACQQAQALAATTNGESTPCQCEEKASKTRGPFFICRSRSTQTIEVDVEAAEAAEARLARQKRIAELCRKGPSPHACESKRILTGIRD